jgi:hypothetical protein
MNKILLKTFLTLTIALVINSLSCFSQIKVELLNDTELTKEGLYFEGTKGIDYQFGKQITPHGDCIDVINGYVFVTWYKGGMDKRILMVSRKKIEGGKWQTIEFPDRHIGYRGDPTKGDSHNTAAIAVCPIDGTVHMIYDMHAYSKASFPDNYFNYRVTKKNAAFVPDEEWNIGLFNEKRHFLKNGVNYERSTYPGFLRFDDGRLLVELRFGGSGNGNDVLAIYDGETWSDNLQYNNGNQPGDGKYSIYGSYQYLHGKLIAGYSIRYSIANSGNHPLYELNNGFFYSEALPPYSVSDWKDLAGNPISLPVQDPNSLKVAEPCDIGIGKRISMGPIWTVTKNGAVHFLTAVSGKNVHYYKAPGSNVFNHSLSTPKANGDFFAFGTKVLNVALENGRVIMRTTLEGENNWQLLYQQKSGDTYRHFRAFLYQNKLFLYLMKVGSGDAQPITLLTYSITDESATKIKNMEKSSLNIYPNPSSGKINIKGLNNDKFVSVYNLFGQIELQFAYDSQKSVNSYSVANLQDGIYFLKTENSTVKFVKIADN